MKEVKYLQIGIQNILTNPSRTIFFFLMTLVQVQTKVPFSISSLRSGSSQGSPQFNDGAGSSLNKFTSSIFWAQWIKSRNAIWTATLLYKNRWCCTTKTGFYANYNARLDRTNPLKRTISRIISNESYSELRGS